MTIGDILRDKKFTNLKLINKEADLTREVSTIESTETPDIALYLTHNAFLITTAMAFKDDQKGLVDLITQLNDLPCAALAIKLGRFIDKLDDDVIETANRLRFPLIQIPLDMTLGNVFHKLLSHLWKNQNEQLLYSLNIQKRFSDLMIRNASLNVLIRNLSNTLKRPIALVDPFGNITHTSGNLKGKLSNKILREVVEDLSIAKSQAVTNISLEDKLINYSEASIYPINMAGYYPYYLIVFDAKNMEYPLSSMVIDQALLIFAFTLYKNLKVEYSLLTSKEEFLKDLIDFKLNETLNENQLLFKGAKYGFKHSRHYQILIGTIDKANSLMDNAAVIEEWYTLVFNWLNEKLIKDVKDYILLPEREKYYYVILLQRPSQNLVERLVAYREVLQKTLHLNISYYMGNVVDNIDDIKHSYQEALDAMEHGKTRNNIDFIKYYNQLDISSLLSLLPKNQIEGFVLETLKSLAYPEDSASQDLRDTLKVYLSLNCNITETANELYIHRNTVKYRIQRCEEILGRYVSDPNYGLELRLSLAYTERE